jgi:hypothetical protein
LLSEALASSAFAGKNLKERIGGFRINRCCVKLLW